VTTFWLSTHLAYACRHSGACCTAGWPIPIERDHAAAVGEAIAARRVPAPPAWYQPDPDAPAEVAGVLTRQGDGACVFYRPPQEGARPSRIGGCAIHAFRPVSCRHFPYVCVTDPRGVHVTLSHFCPTAASLLFDSDREVAIVEGPPVPIDGSEIEGLDARESLPPVAPTTQHPAPCTAPTTQHPAPCTAPGTQHPAPCTAPGTLHPAPGTGSRLLSWDAVTRWEHALVERLAGDTRVPDPPREIEFDRARAAIAPGWSWPDAPRGLATAWRTLVAPEWGCWSGIVGRYLAARAHASWAMHLGAGTSDVERMVELSRTVLQVEASRACLRRQRPLDRDALTEAIRQSDLLLLHLADPYTLVP
jgi:Fe-S-cluster containining protein